MKYVTVLTLFLTPVSVLADEPLSRAEQCEERPVAIAELKESIGRGYVAYEAGDEPGFYDAVDKAECGLGNLQETIGFELAADYHMLMALAHVARKEDKRAIWEIVAFLHIIPTTECSTMFSKEHQICKIWPEAIAARESFETLPNTTSTIFLDGIESTQRPLVSSVIYQVEQRQGIWISTNLLPGEDARIPPRWWERPVLLAVGSGVGLAAAGVTFALADDANDNFYTYDLGYTGADLDHYKARANRFSTGGGIMVGGGIGLGLMAIRALP